VVPAFAQVNEVLGRGQVVALFPEGTRSRDGMLHRGHSGAAHLALTNGVPLVPVGIVGTDRILPSGAKLVRPFRRATIRVGRPVRPSELGLTASTRRTRRQLTDRIMGDIRRLCHQEYVDVYAPLPAGHQHR
jgi:1-acyl-sn-glycerol-3-phosphate acyltransferase